MIKLKVAGKTDIGKRRSSNQDSILINRSLNLYAVADGMGGHSGGEVASALAVRTIEKVYAESRKKNSAEKLKEATLLANRIVHEASTRDPQLNGMGTTLTAAALFEKHLAITQVGDSRCYLFSDDQLFQITEDHSQVYELIKAGLITDSSSWAFQKNVITRSIGYDPEVEVDLYIRPVKHGDKYLLCSDGLSGMVSNEQISQVLTNFPLEKAVDHLVDLANLQGGEDNISVIVFEIE